MCHRSDVRPVKATRVSSGRRGRGDRPGLPRPSRSLTRGRGRFTRCSIAPTLADCARVRRRPPAAARRGPFGVRGGRRARGRGPDRLAQGADDRARLLGHVRRARARRRAWRSSRPAAGSRSSTRRATPSRRPRRCKRGGEPAARRGPPRGRAARAASRRSIEMRALTPVARVRSRQLPLNVLDDLGKIVVRLRVEEPTAVAGDDGRVALPRPAARHRRPRLRPRAARGRRAPGRARARGGARGRSQDDAVAALGGSVGGVSSKLKLKLDPADRADAAAAVILRRLLEIIDANLPGHARRHRLGVPARPARRGAAHPRAAARAARRVRARAAARVSRRLQGAAADHGPDARPRRPAARVRRPRRRRCPRTPPATSRRCACCSRTASSSSAARWSARCAPRARATVLDNWREYVELLVDSPRERAPGRGAPRRRGGVASGSRRSTARW